MDHVFRNESLLEKMMADKACEFCGSQLTGHAEAEFRGQVTFTGQCPKCGTYTLTPDLVAELPNLDAAKRARIGKFLGTSWNLLGQPQELDLNFVKEQLES